MDDQPATPEPHPASPAAARVALHQLIERLTDEEAVALWRLICSWVVPAPGPPPAAP
jgi:hypothetical protein